MKETLEWFESTKNIALASPPLESMLGMRKPSITPEPGWESAATVLDKPPFVTKL
jgi:hypothetical protein